MIQIWRWVVDGLLYQERWSYKVKFLWDLPECHDVHHQCEHKQSVLVMWWHLMQPHNLLLLAWKEVKIIIAVKLVSVIPDTCICFAILKVQYSITDMKQLPERFYHGIVIRNGKLKEKVIGVVIENCCWAVLTPSCYSHCHCSSHSPPHVVWIFNTLLIYFQPYSSLRGQFFLDSELFFIPWVKQHARTTYFDTCLFSGNHVMAYISQRTHSSVIVVAMATREWLTSRVLEVFGNSSWNLFRALSFR